MSVGALHRRLEARGVHVSRRALERLASGQPIASISFSILLPVLDELEVPLGAAFEPIPADEGSPRQSAPDATDDDSSASDVADEELITQLSRTMREKFPSAFGPDGQLRADLVVQDMERRFGGMTISGEDVDKLLDAGLAKHLGTQ